MNEFTLLEVEQLIGRNKLNIIEKRGTKAVATDFAVLCGCCARRIYSSPMDYNYKDPITGYYWLKTDDKKGDPYIIRDNGEKHQIYRNKLNIGARPVLILKNSDISINELPMKIIDGVLEVEYGYYPQQAAPKHIQYELENVYKVGILINTGNKYSLGGKQIPEYEYYGKRYVKVEMNSYFNDYQLSNGEIYKNKDYIWIEVSPVKWLVDLKEELMVSDKIMFSGMEFTSTLKYSSKDFNNTKICCFLNNDFKKDLIQNNHLKTYKNDSPIVHPMVYAYIYYKLYKNRKENDSFIDWEVLSQILYIIEKKEMINGVILEDFVKFSKQGVIDVDDIISGEYLKRSSGFNLGQKFSIAAYLSNVAEKNLETVRNFIMELGDEPLAIFDNLWIHKDKKRLEYIEKLKNNSKKK